MKTKFSILIFLLILISFPSNAAITKWNNLDVGGGTLATNAAATNTLLQGTSAATAKWTGGPTITNLTTIGTGANYMDSLIVTNVLTARTNNAVFDSINTNWVIGTRYTNTVAGGFDARRAKIAYSIELTAAAAGTAKCTLYVEKVGVITNKLSVSAGPLASLITIEPLLDFAGSNDVWYFADETSGAGASIAGAAGTGSWKGW